MVRKLLSNFHSIHLGLTKYDKPKKDLSKRNKLTAKILCRKSMRSLPTRKICSKWSYSRIYTLCKLSPISRKSRLRHESAIRRFRWSIDLWGMRRKSKMLKVHDAERIRKNFPLLWWKHAGKIFPNVFRTEWCKILSWLGWLHRKRQYTLLHQCNTHLLPSKLAWRLLVKWWGRQQLNLCHNKRVKMPTWWLYMLFWVSVLLLCT